jgi:hypothetical protein
MFQIFDTVKFYICFICYDVFHILLSWDSLRIHGMYRRMYICSYKLKVYMTPIYLAKL